MDSSTSIGLENFQRVVDFAKSLTLQLPIGGGTRVGLLTYSDNPKVSSRVRYHGYSGDC